MKSFRTKKETRHSCTATIPEVRSRRPACGMSEAPHGVTQKLDFFKLEILCMQAVGLMGKRTRTWASLGNKF